MMHSGQCVFSVDSESLVVILFVFTVEVSHIASNVHILYVRWILNIKICTTVDFFSMKTCIHLFICLNVFVLFSKVF